MKRLSIILLLFSIASNNYVYAQEKHQKRLTDLQIVSLIDSLKKSLIRYYIFPDKALSMGKHLSSQLKKGAYKGINDQAKLAYKLESDIKEINYDSHLHVNFEPGLLAPKKLSSDERAMAMKEQLATEIENNFNLQKAEILPGNIGYFLFNGFTGNINEAKPILNGALTFLSGTRALIIDLRNNGGGNSNNRLESYFFKERTHLIDNVNTFNKDTLSIYADPKTTNGLTLLMPIYILTSKNTFSAAEAFSASMQSLKRAIIVGDTTGGGSHLTGTFDLKNGFVAKIPFARPVSTSTFKDWEGVGVVPDIPVKASRALQMAQEVIYKKFLLKAKSDKDKRKIQWAINALIAEQNPLNMNSNSYSKYAGSYSGGIQFYVENNQLLCRNPERGGTDVFKLTPVSNDIFLLDENVQIEFLRDENDIYASLKMLWKDGNVSQRSKE
ncbi:S41 family peptidase [Pedobacter agri]|uniref:S41 family peptidase n=1 Tax=Pedobacter agri TaxID=454586 RepID=UPI00292D5CF9|nr:S41 family peptidase [Pedobacter agri]